MFCLIVNNDFENKLKYNSKNSINNSVNNTINNIVFSNYSDYENFRSFITLNNKQIDYCYLKNKENKYYSFLNSIKKYNSLEVFRKVVFNCILKNSLDITYFLGNVYINFNIKGFEDKYLKK